MLRRINAELFEAPAGARIRIVAESQGNNGVNDARFEYGSILPRETILGLPGCSFTVEDDTQALEAVVVFDSAAPGSARYDLFEVEEGVKIDLGKFVRNSESAPLIGFALQPAELPMAVPFEEAARRPSARKRARKRKAAKKGARKKTARRGAKRKASRRKTVRASARRRTSSKRTTARKRK